MSGIDRNERVVLLCVCGHEFQAHIRGGECAHERIPNEDDWCPCAKYRPHGFANLAAASVTTNNQTEDGKDNG